MDIRLSASLSISTQEVTFQFARSSGPGGQHINKVSTAATLCFDVAGSKSLSERHKRVLQKKLRTRMNKQGILRVTSRRHRSQAANKKAAMTRFAALLSHALQPQKLRVKTTMPRAAKEKRIRQKKHRGLTKQLRKTPILDSN